MAKKKNGFIQLSRDVLELPFWVSPEPYSRRDAYVSLYFMAHYQDQDLMLKNGRFIHIKRGQVFTTLKTLCTTWHWSKDKVRYYLKTLDLLGLAHTVYNANGTTITLEKYGLEGNQHHTDPTTDQTSDPTTDQPSDQTSDPTQYNNKFNKYSNKGNKVNKGSSAPALLDPWGEEYQ